MIVNLTKDIERAEKPTFHSREKLFFENFLENLDNQVFDAQFNFNGFSLESSSTGFRFLIDNLTEKFNSGVNVEIQFQKWEKSKMIVFFRFFEQWGLWR